jgi:DNA-binding CsgD family transcriptional regulator
VAWIDPLIVAGRMTVDQMRGDVDAVVARGADAAQRMAAEPVQRQQAGGYAVTVARALADAGRHDEIEDACRPLLAWAEGAAPWSEADATMVDLARDDRPGAAVDWSARADRLTSVVGVHDEYRLGFGHGFPRLEAATAALNLGDEHQARNLARPLLELLSPSRLGILRVEGDRRRDVLSLFATDPTFGPAVQAFGLVGVPGEPDAGPIEVPGTGEVLSRREVEVLRLVADGLSNRDVGVQLYISERTVKSHMTAVLRKTGARNRTEAAGVARQLGLS